MNILKLISTIAFLICSLMINAQTSAEVKNVDFIVVNDTMKITYDFDKSKNNELFNISVCVKTISGKIIYPKALSGDVGENVKGGKGKKVFWAITKDNSTIDEEGYVEITAKSNIINSIDQNKPLQIGAGKAIALSALLPGLGNTKLSGGKPYWLLGIAAYGCLASGIYMTMNAKTAMEVYETAATETTRDESYSKSKSNTQTATYLFIGAGTIWVGDLIFTAIQAKKVNKATSMNKRIFVGYNYDTAMKQSMMMFIYKF